MADPYILYKLEPHNETIKLYAYFLLKHTL